MNERQVLISRLLLSVQPQLSGEMNEHLRQLVGQLVYSLSMTMTADQDQHKQTGLSGENIIENIRQVTQGVRRGQRRASPPANQLIADINNCLVEVDITISLPKNRDFVYCLCNKPLSSIENLYIHCRCRFDPLSFSPALVLLSSFKFLLTSRQQGSNLSARTRQRRKGACFSSKD